MSTKKKVSAYEYLQILRKRNGPTFYPDGRIKKRAMTTHEICAILTKEINRDNPEVKLTSSTTLRNIFYSLHRPSPPVARAIRDNARRHLVGIDLEALIFQKTIKEPDFYRAGGRKAFYQLEREAGYQEPDTIDDDIVPPEPEPKSQIEAELEKPVEEVEDADNVVIDTEYNRNYI